MTGPSRLRRASSVNASRNHRRLRTSVIVIGATIIAGYGSGSYTSAPALAASTPATAIHTPAATTTPTIVVPGLAPPADDPFYQTASRLQIDEGRHSA